MSTDLRAEIAMMLDYTQFQAGLEAVKGSAGGAFDGISRDANMLKGMLAGLGGALSVVAFAGMIKGAIDGAAALQELSIKTGASVESLSGLAAVGKLTGTSADTIAGAMNKMAKSTSTVDEAGKGAAQALRALGIDFDSFQKMSPDQKMVAVAKAMDGFADGSGKSAAAMLLLGKSGADLLPYMRDLAAVGDLQAKVTSEQAARAYEFDRSLTQLQASGAGWGKELAMGMLPALSDVTKAMVEVFNQSGGLRDQLRKLSADGTIDQWTRTAITGFTYVADAVEYGWKVIKGFAEGLGAYAASAVAYVTAIGTAASKALAGDFTGALDAASQGLREGKTILAAYGSTMANTFGEQTMGSKIRARMGELQRVGTAVKVVGVQVDLHAAAVGKDTAATKKLDEETRKLIATWEAAEKAGEDLMRATDLKNDELQRELDMGRALLPVEKDLLKFEQDLAAGKVIMSVADMAATREKMKLNAQLVEEIKWLRDSAKANQDAKDAQDKSTAAVHDAVVKQTESNAVMGLSSTALQAHEQALLADKAAALLAKAANMDLIDVDMAAKLRAEAGEWTKLVELKQQAFDAKEAQAFFDTISKGVQSFSEGLVSSLEHGLPGLKQYLKHELETMVIKVPLQFIGQQLGNLATGLVADALGAKQPGAAGGGAAGALNTASNAATLYGAASGYSGWVNTAASVFGAGATAGASAASLAYANAVGAVGGDALGALIAANGSWGGVAAGGANVGAAISGGAAAEGGIAAAGGYAAAEGGLAAAGGAAAAGEGAAAAAGSEALAAAGPYGWIALAVIAILAMTASGGTPHVGGYAKANSDGSIDDITGQQGGIQDAQMQTIVSAFAASTVDMIQGTAKLFGATANVAVRSVFESDGEDGSWGLFHVLDQLGNQIAGRDSLGTLDSDASKGFEEFVNSAAGAVRDTLVSLDLPKWVDATLTALGDAPAMKDLVESLQKIQAYQAAMDTMAASLAPLGGVFTQISGLSSDAKDNLIGMAGGIDALMQKTAAYVQGYFTADEQMAIKAVDLLKRAKEAGIDATGANEKSDLRTLMDSLNLSNEADRVKMVALLNLSGDYASVGDYLQKQGITLGELAQQAPSVGALEALKDPATVTADATKATADNTHTVADNTKATTDAVDKVADKQDTQTALTQDGFAKLSAQMDTMIAALNAISTAMKVSAARGTTVGA